MNITRKHIRSLSTLRDLKKSVDNFRTQARENLNNLRNGLGSRRKHKSDSQYAAQFPKVPKGSPDDLRYALQFPKAPKGSLDHQKTPTQGQGRIRKNKASRQKKTRSSVQAALRIRRQAEKMQQQREATTHRFEKRMAKMQDSLQQAKNTREHLKTAFQTKASTSATKNDQKKPSQSKHKAPTNKASKQDNTRASVQKATRMIRQAQRQLKRAEADTHRLAKRIERKAKHLDTGDKKDFQFIKKHYPSAAESSYKRSDPKSTTSKTDILLTFFQSLKKAPPEKIQEIYDTFKRKSDKPGQKSDYEKLNTHRGYGIGLTKSAQAVESIFQEILKQKKPTQSNTSNITMTPMKDGPTQSSTFKDRYQRVTERTSSENTAPKEEGSFENKQKGP